jgi:mono/diheme cytochrome c family protein
MSARLLRVFLPVLLYAAACSPPPSTQDEPQMALPGAELPPEHSLGQSLFDRYCSKCHGPSATGSPAGPPLVHRLYEPNHHADVSFLRAVQFGVRAHHWKFGDMPPVSGVTTEEISPIVAYVRWLQKQAGIF